MRPLLEEMGTVPTGGYRVKGRGSMRGLGRVLQRGPRELGEGLIYSPRADTRFSHHSDNKRHSHVDR